MKKLKKILAVSLPVLLLSSVASLLMPIKAEAYVATSATQIQNATFEFVNRGLIKVKIGEKTIDFVDTKPFDYGLKYIAQGYECDSFIGDEEKMDEKFALTNLGNYPGSLNTDWIHIKYNDGKGNGCQEVRINKWPGGVDVGMRTWFNWVDAGALEIIDGSRRFTKTGSNDYFLYTGESGESCQDRVFLNTSTTRAGDNTPSKIVLNSGKYFELDKDGEVDPSKTDAKGLNLGNDCKITGFNFLDSISGEKAFNNYYNNASFALGAVQNRDKPAGEGTFSNGQKSGTTTGGDTGDSDTSDCVANGGTTLEWILCPIITSISKATEGINALIEGQLNFNVSENLNNDIKRVWSIVRVLATSMLVIIMLVMVISQAIGTGLFDAYTVRKMLPRLVLAAIAMQLSWDAAVWVIGLANDAGQGIKQIIALPFGGAGELDLPSLLNRLSSTWAGITSVSLLAFLIAVPTLAVAFLPGVVVVAFTVFVGAVVALATLLFRNVLIISGVIFLPLALLAWILPGTQKYWSFWKDNFIKLLLLFPLIIAVIYIGRVFAWMAAGLGEPGFLDFAMVLVGFFGPYFIIPKAFKWGGSMLATASRGINENSFVRKGREKGVNELKGWQDRRNRQFAKAYGPDDPMFGVEKKKWGIPYRFNGRFARSIQAARYMPTRRAQGKMIQGGNEWNSEEDTLEELIAARGREKATKSKRDIGAGKKRSMDRLEDALTALSKDPTDSKMARQAKNALKDLIATSSTYELHNLKVNVTGKDGKQRDLFAWQTDAWRDLLAGNPDIYGKIAGATPDWASHRTPTGIPGYRGEYTPDQELIDRNNMQKDGLGSAEIDRKISEKKERANWLSSFPEYDIPWHENPMWAASLGTTVEELTGPELARIHPSYFDRIGQMGDSGKKKMQEAWTARSEGRTEDAAKLFRQAKELLAPAREFGRFMERLAKDQGGRNQIAAVTGGSDSLRFVDHALEHSGKGNIDKILHEARVNEAAETRIGPMQPGETGELNLHPVQPQAQAQPTVAKVQAQPIEQVQAPTAAPTVTQPVVMNVDNEVLGRTIGRHVGEALGDVISPLQEAIRESTQQRSSTTLNVDKGSSTPLRPSAPPEGPPNPGQSPEEAPPRP